MKIKNQIILSLLVVTMLSLTACGSASQTAANPGTNTAAADSSSVGTRNTITVNSSESVTVTPDIAEVVLAVQTESTDAAKCQAENAEEVNSVIDMLKGFGVAETSIQTTDYYMSPVYSYSNDIRKLKGYEAATVLTLSDLPIDSLGELLTKTVNAGVNNIRSISYLSSVYDESYQEALKLAMQSSLSKADALAQAGGCTLGSVVGVQENSNYSEARYADNKLASYARNESASEGAMMDGGAQIMPGQIDVEVDITVEYLIK